jgi:hypothetical protein
MYGWTDIRYDVPVIVTPSSTGVGSQDAVGGRIAKIERNQQRANSSMDEMQEPLSDSEEGDDDDGNDGEDDDSDEDSEGSGDSEASKADIVRKDQLRDVCVNKTGAFLVHISSENPSSSKRFMHRIGSTDDDDDDDDDDEGGDDYDDNECDHDVYDDEDDDEPDRQKKHSMLFAHRIRHLESQSNMP